MNEPIFYAGLDKVSMTAVGQMHRERDKERGRLKVTLKKYSHESH